ncbi:YcgN family cysteine cluster protein [Kangiella sp. TOML190]|uniref:YcgN family cysteine cluster protein n=1 Tax=Kangiella sp. TOML190 TaxID=2931351 RepID=UPI00203CC6D6|nr:YcgN family cysteine cluster protein [Kangiella sp. TOML190]
MAAFWLDTPMDQMTAQQWESLCDGCAKCCRMQFVDEEEELLMQTDVVCYLLDESSLQCTDYANRTSLVPDCMQISPENIKEFYWLPETCGYRRVAAGKDLPEWHHLKSGSRELIHELGFSVKGKVTPEQLLAGEDIEDRIISWIPIEE